MTAANGLSAREYQVYELLIRMRAEKGRKAGVTQQELADAIGIDKAVISRTLATLRIRGIVKHDDRGASTVIVKRLRRKSA